MEIDFHFGMTYAVGRIAGFQHKEAELVATCSQYVDDTINSGVLKFYTGQSYSRIRSSHDYMDHSLYEQTQERKVWVPFHFIPGNRDEGPSENDFFNRLVCRPNSPIAQQMLDACIEAKGADHSLHRLGITAHVFIDTWAHQGFAGLRNKINRVTDIDLGEESNWINVLKHLGTLLAGFHLWEFICRIVYLMVPDLFDVIFPMGHGAALHYPDHPFRKWSYKNGYKITVVRDNPTDFLAAADHLCQFFRRYISGAPSAPGLSDQEKIQISQLIKEFTNDDGKIRNQQWLEKIRQGYFAFGAASPEYNLPVKNSWKFLAYGGTSDKVFFWQRFDYKESFMGSDWKLFHDALQAHQHAILHEILPHNDLCVV